MPPTDDNPPARRHPLLSPSLWLGLAVSACFFVFGLALAFDLTEHRPVRLGLGAYFALALALAYLNRDGLARFFTKSGQETPPPLVVRRRWLLIAYAMPAIPLACIVLDEAYLLSGRGSPLSQLAALGVVLLLAAVAWIHFGAFVLVRRAQERDGRICPECGYDLRDRDDEGRCPECGTPYSLSALHEAWFVATLPRVSVDRGRSRSRMSETELDERERRRRAGR